jgi:membrane-bound metal-dependent hydrolase YbcI (DUF457 family)
MFLGHFAVGFASKGLAPRASLGVLMVAPLLCDVVMPVFLALGVEHVRIDRGATAVLPLDLYDYPWSHSLVMTIAWAIAAAALYRILRGDTRAALVIGAAVMSHWVLDFVTHRADMQLWPGSATRVGLGLWHSVIGTIAVEAPIFAAGVAIYAGVTRARDRVGRVALAALVIVLVAMYAASFFVQPPDVATVIVGSFVAWVFFPWAAWVDRHREGVARGA